MESNFIDDVYASIQCVFDEDVLVPEVKAAFTEEQICMQLYSRVFDAKCRINDKYNGGHELHDVEEIIDAMFDIMAEVGHQMYLYGAKFGIPEGTDIRTPQERWLTKKNK